MSRREIVGTYKRQIDDKTIVVEVETKYSHPKYGKTVTKHKDFLVHIEKEPNLEEGTQVLIAEIRPVSKRKSFELVSIYEENK